MTPNRKALLALTALCFFCVELAEARLLRGTGRSSPSFNDGQVVFYAAPEQLNIVGITPEAFDTGVSFFPSKVPIDQNRGVAAVPNSCIKGFDDNDRVAAEDFIFDLEQDIQNEEFGNNDPAVIANLESQIAAERIKFSNDPCGWQFEEGEALALFGAFSMAFEVPDITFDVTWNITGDGESFSLLGSVITEATTTPDGEVFLPGGGVSLEVPAPAGLGVGDYFLSVAVTLNAPGRFFFTEVGEVELVEVCEENPAYIDFFQDPANFEDNDVASGALTDDAIGRIPEQDICGYQSLNFNDEQEFARTTYTSEAELLRIVTATGTEQGPSATVNAPSTLLCSLLGLLTLRRRRRG